ncbi:MAG: nucleoside hydrolase, partial [Aeriscardovia sp.]|nr:nucleoside hydrolase [Aeriscardovia sp.]
MKKLILDLDTGIDDTLAMSLAMASPEVDLIGIIGTYGNVYMDQGLRNDLAITDLFGKKIKVYRGLDHALKKDSFEVMEISSFIH